MKEVGSGQDRSYVYLLGWLINRVGQFGEEDKGVQRRRYFKMWVDINL